VPKLDRVGNANCRDLSPAPDVLCETLGWDDEGMNMPAEAQPLPVVAFDVNDLCSGRTKNGHQQRRCALVDLLEDDSSYSSPLDLEEDRYGFEQAEPFPAPAGPAQQLHRAGLLLEQPLQGQIDLQARAGERLRAGRDEPN